MITPDLEPARDLVAAGFTLVALKRHSKAPAGLRWNDRKVQQVMDDATGYGFPLAINGRCSIDPDNVQLARRGLAACGFDLDEIMAAGVRTESTREGSGGRSMFQVADGLEWIRFRTKNNGLVLELRAKSDNLQDAVPGVVYKDREGTLCTQRYANGRTYEDAPELPPAFAAWWLRMSQDIDFQHDQIRKFCAGIGSEVPVLSASVGEHLAYAAPGIRQAFNERHDPEDFLMFAGYDAHSSGRWSPPGATGEPGVRPIPGKDGLWRSDHGSDPLCGTFDAWSAFVVLEHDGDVQKAINAFTAAHPGVVVPDTQADVKQFPKMDGFIADYSRVDGRGRHAGKIESTIDQLTICVGKDPEFPFSVAFDDFMQDVLISIDGAPPVRYQDEHITQMRAWFDRRGWEPVSKSDMRDVIHAVARARRTDIAIDWGNSLVWDDVDRFGEACKRMHVEDTPHSRAVVDYQWTGHAGRLMQPGTQADSIFVLAGPQGYLKTSYVHAIAPDICGFPTANDINISDLLQEDKSARALRHLLVGNLDEMRGFGKRESAEVKTALTRRTESYVPKYMETRMFYPRRCLLYATNNELSFLDDPTGSRRYAVLTPQAPIDVQWFMDNRDQLWAQGIAQWRKSGVAWQALAELSPEVNEQYEVEDPMLPIVANYAESCVTHITIGGLLEALEIAPERQTVALSRRFGSILRQLGYQRVRIRENGQQVKVWAKGPDS